MSRLAPCEVEVTAAAPIRPGPVDLSTAVAVLLFLLIVLRALAPHV